MNSNSSNPYGVRASGKGHGDVYTRDLVVNYMLDLVGYVEDRDLSGISILEPACGDGAFLVEILRRLSLSARRFHFDADRVAHERVLVYELDADKIKEVVRRVRLSSLPFERIESLIRHEDFLKAVHPMVDIVIGNPPYVRYERLPEETIRFCKRTFPTFYYRADLYIPFYEKSLRSLKPGGKHCFICSNRWLRNESGRLLRGLITSAFHLEYVADMERTSPFQEKVAAYTDIVLISRARSKGNFRFHSIDKIEDLAYTADALSLPAPQGEDWSGSFNPSMRQDGLYGLEELGLRIGIGIATGADRVFISERLRDDVEESLLIPAISGRDLRGDVFRPSKSLLLNPYNPDGTLIDLGKYPRARDYLLRHADVLKARHIARKKPGAWYRTIDKVNPSLRGLPKILLPDMSANTRIFVDGGSYYPTHSLYYITGADVRGLKLVSALLMSAFVASQLSDISTSMNGGFIRWQSQYLHKLRIPDVLSLKNERSASLLDAYEKSDLKNINKITSQILSDPDMVSYQNRDRGERYRQLSLF